ncbi:1,4-dihydroxy-2-naphthoate octaprenyltransferase [Alicyclobacillus cellulosilyticus]|uniref:1,4-dihydroxy-2-naphthoate octaprenyltransferase n=2 Tax=Alicyclobacillus cellulosilyticus TaxID=1003997 RepID=A0A917KGS4_9BACL|nr:1,4-dihydroxy-2-naphthoate octaprenyltransferase [Alicyclobacillus cellulosilyticus]
MSLTHRIGVAWRLVRPFTLSASVAPVLVGTGMAIPVHPFRGDLFVCFLLASLLIQAATNMLNEYFDYKRGLDSEAMVGIAGTIVRDGVEPRTVLRSAWLSMAVAIALGVYICAETSWWIALVGLACMAVAYLYSGGPKPLSSTPFGELAAAVSMGPVIVLLAYFIQTRHLDAPVVWVSVPVGLFIGAILLGNNIRDMELDRAGGRRTVPIVLGRARATALFAAVFCVAYAMLVTLVACAAITPFALAVLLTAPTAWYVAKRFFEHKEPSKLHPAVKGTATLLFRVSAILFVAQVLPVWIHTV